MNRTGLYRALLEAGTSEGLAKEAAESVVYAHEAATKTDLAEAECELKAEMAGFANDLKAAIAELKSELRTEMAAMEARLVEKIERGLRNQTIALAGLIIASQAGMFALMKLL